MRATIIGIDCATKPEKCGLARAEADDGRLQILEARPGRRGESLAEQIATWITTDPPTQLALAAPLGWPAALGAALASTRPASPSPLRPTGSSTDIQMSMWSR